MLYQRKEELEREFGLLISLMADMITAQAMQHDPTAESPQWMFSQHDLAKKLFRLMWSARSLLEPSPFQNRTIPPYSYIDHSSIAVLTRSSLENYLVMTWLLSGGTESLQEFRHNVWEYCGWKKRSKMAATTFDARKVQQVAKEDADALWPLIQSSPHFQNYTESQRKRVCKGDWGVGAHWNDLAVEAGLHRTYFTSTYHFLSGHVHSDYIGAIQNGQAITLKDQYMLGTGHLQVIVMLMGHFSHHYASLFPPAKNVLLNAGEVREIAEKWNLSAEDMDFLYCPENEQSAD